MKNVTSGKDYAKQIIDLLIEGELEAHPDNRMDSKLLQYWCDEIADHADKTFYDYIKGDRESYLFTDTEFKELFEKAGMRYASDLLEGLVDKEMVQLGVREDGEIVYSLSEKGRKHLEE